MEFDLLCNIINFANQYAARLEKQLPSFHITTNGTLLNDDIVRFLVKYDVAVLISLDGTKNSHDRYRKYKTHGAECGSTFDKVMERIRRFVDLYPNYTRRGISMVLTHPLDVNENNAIMRELLPFFPTSRVSSVKKPDSCYSCEKSSTSIDLVDKENVLFVERV